ncbi:MAG: 30S ribosomal protein S20 [Candidatus Aminicenantes bacterium]|nr:30S ribosomal protein S20 [Candidatus Aminicenantes bacterium]
MANHKSAIQQWRTSLRRRANNKKAMSLLRTEIKKLRAAIAEKDKDKTKELLPRTFSLIDRSVKKGAIHKSTGNRYKSRLASQVEVLISASSK